MQDLSQVVYAIGRAGPSGVTLLGTCFAVGPRQVATAFHVPGADDTNLVLVLPNIKSSHEYQDTANTSLQLAPLKIAAADPMRDLSVLELPHDVTLNFTYEFGGSDDVPPGDAIVSPGFPHANVGRLVFTQHRTHVGARVLIENSGLKSKHIVMNTQAREGQSGGPVLNESMTHVVAVLIGSYAPNGGGGISLGGVDPWTLHQTTHAISAEYLAGML